MTEHTPGPWYIMGDDECPASIPVIEISRGDCPSPEYKQLAYVQPSSTPPDHDDFHLSDEDWANARLIAAAPELLEALEAIGADNPGCRVDHLNPCWDDRPSDVLGRHWGGGEACSHCMARAALAKARGQ